jgi:mannose-6-phosphate isomerase-like protein (cupin superfamily)
VDIPAKVKHRVLNHADGHLVIIEVQTGARCDDGDIERFEDLYGRI